MNKTELRAQLGEGTAWHKSTKSGPYSDNCVEVAFLDGGVALRDSKDQAREPHVFDDGEWSAFVAGAKDGEFDLG